MLSSIIAIFLFSFYLHAAELECTPKGEMIRSYFDKEFIEEGPFCYNLDKTVITSVNCKEFRCPFVERARSLKRKKYFSAFGKPGFRICRENSGKPELIILKIGLNTFKLDRCVFPDKSFVSTDVLLKELELPSLPK